MSGRVWYTGYVRMKPLNPHRLKSRSWGRYEALWKGRVVASARNHAALLKKIMPIYRTQPLELRFVPPKGMYCVYSLSA